MTSLKDSCKLTQETQDSWFKVLPIALMRAWTAPKKKKGLSLWQTGFVHRHCNRSWRLRINYVTQLSAFQQTLGELQKVTPDPASIIGLIAGSVEHSPLHQLKASMVGFSISRKRLFSTLSISSPTIITCDVSLIWWHLAIMPPLLGCGVASPGHCPLLQVGDSASGLPPLASGMGSSSRQHGCVGAGRPRRAIPCSRS